MRHRSPDALKVRREMNVHDASKRLIPTAVPHGYWNDIANQRYLLDKIGKQLGVQEVSVRNTE